MHDVIPKITDFPSPIPISIKLFLNLFSEFN